MIITILINVVFVVSLIMFSFYFVTAIKYDITLIDKAYMSLLIGVFPGILYDCLLYDISQDDLKKFRHMSRNKQIAFLKSVITTVESAEKEESTDENGNKVITTKTVIQQVPLIENDEELAEYEPILRKNKVWSIYYDAYRK